MIRMLLEVRHQSGRPDITRPVVLCDQCGEEIRDASHGAYLFDGRAENPAYWRSEPVELYAVHKKHHGGCWGAFVAARGWDEDRVTDGELSDLPAYLAGVLGTA